MPSGSGVSEALTLQTEMQAELRGIEGAVAAGTRETGRGLKTDLRRQVASAGPSKGYSDPEHAGAFSDPDRERAEVL